MGRVLKSSGHLAVWELNDYGLSNILQAVERQWAEFGSNAKYEELDIPCSTSLSQGGWLEQIGNKVASGQLFADVNFLKKTRQFE